VPPYSHQADVWVELLKHFHYRQIVFIHSSDTDGRSILGKDRRDSKQYNQRNITRLARSFYLQKTYRVYPFFNAGSE
jgi:hypothetical protein